ncbi:MAG TPA: hypothetical protein VGL81_17105 [Polyangiaceae bacterium]|jgi:hypothetical protein
MSGPTTLARSEADAFERGLFKQQTLTTVRYADPVAWIVATAAVRAFGAAHDAVVAAGDRVGVVVTSARGPVETMAWVATAARDGFSSPLRYPATNPGSLAGVTCIALGLRGPTLVLTMPPEQGARLGLVLGERWIARGDVLLALVATCWEPSPGKQAARCMLVGAGAGGPPVDAATDGAWLAALDARSVRA